MELNVAVFERPLGSVGAKAERDKQYDHFLKYSLEDIGFMVNKVENRHRGNKPVYIFYFKVPFESNYKYKKKGFFDVIFQLNPPPSPEFSALRLAQINAVRPVEERVQSLPPTSLEDYSFQVFSNSPGFMFTYTFVYNHYGLLIPWIDKKFYSSLALSKPPMVRNPRLLIYYEKSVWHPFFLMKRFHLFDTAVLEKYIDTNLNNAYITARIMNQEDKKAEMDRFEAAYKESEANIKRNNKRRDEFLNRVKTYSRFGAVSIADKPDFTRLKDFRGRYVQVGRKL